MDDERTVPLPGDLGGASLRLFVADGLGDATYLLVADGRALVVDPQRDVDRVLTAAAAMGAAIDHVLETHVHNDYVSGSTELRGLTGAAIAAPAGGGYAFDTLPMADGTELRLGPLRLVALHTPGHTPEHVSYALFGEGRPDPAAVFTGGSLIVGSAGRTDLLGASMTDELTRSQYRSVRRLMGLPPRTLILPTHGAGSFCASGTAGQDRVSTVGREREDNPALDDVDEDTFVRRQLSGLSAYPRYYAHMAPINRAGPPLAQRARLPEPIPATDLAALLAQGVELVDARAGPDFAAAHVPGSLNVPLDESFASYVAWVLPFDHPIALVLPEPLEEARAEIATQLFRIGYSAVRGYVEGGLEAWRACGGEVDSYPSMPVGDLVRRARDPGDEVILDVRQRSEWDAGHIGGSEHVFVADVSDAAARLRGGHEVLVSCATGFRASIASSLLAREGVRVRLVAPGGIPDAVRLLR